MSNPSHVLVTGAGGFIGGHLVQALLHEGLKVRAVDLKAPARWHQLFPDAENLVLDLREKESCRQAVQGCDWVYQMAADMGGIGFIEKNKALSMLSVLTNTHMLMASLDAGVSRYFYASSACVYADNKQAHPGTAGLREEDAYPASPEDGYGWEKLFSERMCRHFQEDFGFSTCVARYHNIYGPHGTFDGGREKAPAAICRKVIEAKLSGNHEITIWGDGEQTRSFTYIDDCIHGTRALMQSTINTPLNLGSSEKITINQLVDLVENLAGLKLERHYDRSAPQGVRGRNSDNTRILEKLGWEPSTPLLDGMAKTYEWIWNRMISTQKPPH